MHDVKAMRFVQSLADLFGDIDSFADGQTPRPSDEPLQIFSGYEFHSDVVGACLFVQIVHATNISMADFAGEF